MEVAEMLGAIEKTTQRDDMDIALGGFPQLESSIVTPGRHDVL
jgi:hypothetical protein